MKLDKIAVSNFKGLKSVEFAPGTFACLVGENNAGKSSVLQAIVSALHRPTQLSPALFYDTGQPIEFRLNFSGVTEDHLQRLAPEHRTKISEIVIDESLTVIVRYRPESRADVSTQRLIPRDERYKPDSIDAVFAGKRGGAVRQALLDSYPEFADAAPDVPNITAAKEFLRGRIAVLPREALELVEVPLPSGIASSITALLPEPIYIPAVKNLSDDLKTTQSTSFGRLLGLLLEDMAPDLERVNRALAELNSLLNRVVEGNNEQDQRHEKVRHLEALIENLLSQNFPRVRVELRIPPPELKTILNAAQIYIDDGSRDLIDNKGDGIKRSLTFALLQAYVQQLAARQAAQDDGAPPQRPLMFLFEEPELYLHPRSQRVLFDTLARISAVHQVVVTTHSPLFFAPGVTAAFVRVTKQDAAPKPIGRLYPVNLSLNDNNSEAFRLAHFENADAAFFSRRVVLFEGESDDTYCKHVAKTLNPNWDFDKKNIAMVRVSGKGNFSKFRTFFAAFGIEVKLIADLDALFEGFQHLGATQGASAARDAALPTLDQRINALGIVAEPAARQIRTKVNQDSWRARYQAAKEAVRGIQAGGAADQAALSALDRLFTWEHDIARVRVCREDAEAAAAIVPVLDALRADGICVLARGAIEDYYPDGAPTSGAKPDRALHAVAMVAAREAAEALSRPLGPARRDELSEVFAEVFRDL